MKKFNLVLLAFSMLLVSCNDNFDSDSLNNSTSNNSSSVDSESSTESTSLSDTSSLKEESTSISDTSSSKEESTTLEGSSTPEEVPTVSKIKYSTHPFSEPDVNKQLVTFNPMGDLMSTWDHYRGDGVLVAVIDSGFDYDHPEFTNEDGTSKISDKSAYIYTSNNVTSIKVGKTYTDITDGDSHGTMCAGLLGASVNKKGITGIAPNVDLMLIKIDKKAESMAEAFKYAADNGARVISTSLGAYPNVNGESSGDIHFSAGYDLSKAFNENINYAYSKGVSIVAATGNSKTTTLSYPAGCDNVIGAGGLNAGSQTLIWDNGYEGSNYNGSKTYVDVFAPSDGIYAPGFDMSTNKPTYWGDAKGTSFAAPLIAGAIALYLQKYPNHTNVDVEKALKASCVNISSYNGNKNMGLGRLDVGKFLNIDEDICKDEIVSTTTINQKVTKLTIVDEEGWDFRTLHLYNVTFASGYGYKELEEYFLNEYGRKIPTSSYQKEGTTRGFAYTDEGYIGDYYLCLGNTDHAVKTNYEYIFPWWVYGAYYQIVNNSNWMPEGGNYFSYSNGYGKDIKSYFWYDSETQFGLSQVVGAAATANIKAVNVNKVLVFNNQEVYNKQEKTSVYDIYTPSNETYNSKSVIGWYLDSKCSIPYIEDNIIADATIYGLIQ